MVLNVVFVHPDLGIGGAERAVIDAALALKTKGHSVQFLTAHHDSTHCFQETKDGTLQVTAVGDWLPRSILGRCFAFCAYVRMIYAALYLILFSSMTYDIIFCDQVSACIPVLNLSRKKVIFYCHFPDMLLTTRKSFLKKLYRAPIDWIEEKTTGLADVVLVNSKFTGGVFKDTFPSLKHVTPQVVYPIPNFSALEDGAQKRVPTVSDVQHTFLSINRYERKKNHALVIHALGELRSRLGHLRGIRAVIAGGYDERVAENREYYEELVRLAADAELSNHVTFLRSFSDADKRVLLASSTCLLYTPANEHFGIVPLEAMHAACPVIAVNSGGPRETVEHGETGFLCEQTAAAFAQAMEKFIVSSTLKATMGRKGQERVRKLFSFEAYANTLHKIVSDATAK